MNVIKAIQSQHHTHKGFLIFAIIEFILAYLFSSLAIDRGNLLWYFLGIVSLIGGVKNTVNLIRSLISGHITLKAK
ncbi:MAG: hypothetical protein ACHQT9_01295 [Candidatus Saccharimonadales bacterium]